MISRIKNFIVTSLHHIYLFISCLSRIKFAHSDMTKSLSNAKPLEEKQKDSIRAYWKPFLNNYLQKKAFDVRWFDVYNHTNRFGYKIERYIPDGYYYGIVDHFLTDEKASKVVDDKNFYDLYFPDVKQPQTIARKVAGTFLDKDYNIITIDEVLNLCIDVNVIIKPSVETVQGKGIVVWKQNDSLENLKEALTQSNNFIIQEFIEQHKMLSDFCNTCVNTMRLVTLFWNNEVHLTSSVLIMGGVNAKTNHLHGGGIVCGILPSGQLRNVAFDGNLNSYEQHPNGQVFSEITVPNFDKCVEMVKKLAPRLSRISKLLNWDLTLDVDGNPILIEVNLTWGGTVQIAGGPALGDLTEEVLTSIAHNSK